MSTMRPRLVVLGCGFGGYSLLLRLPKDLYDVTLISPRNYFLFLPLLPSAVTGTVEFRSIVEPVRRRLRHVRLLEGSATAVDWERRVVRAQGAVDSTPFEAPFDELVIAVGGKPSDYGVPGVSSYALHAASIENAREIRRAILTQFARAGLPGLAAEEVQRLLTFVVCGGGPTGVEVAAEIHDLLTGELRRAFPDLAPRARLVLLEAGQRLLNLFKQALSTYAERHFRREGIEVRMHTTVAAIGATEIVLRDGGRLPYGMVVWAGGNGPTGFVEGLKELSQLRGRLQVDSLLRLVGRDRAYALGDCASCGDPPLPATAQVAQKQGKYLAKTLKRRARGGGPDKPFVFRSVGMLAYVGKGHALADMDKVQWSGRGAWILWRSIYLTKLVSLPNKVKVLFDWIKNGLFGRDLSRF
jgi:NADH:ubiquinone reductase (non-electrogenic)